MTTRRTTKTIVLAAVLVVWSRCALALNPALEVNQYAHTAWLIRDGFVKGVIRAISQAPDGYLWLATEFGVVRFDGITAVSWQPPGDQRLPSSDIWSVVAARDGSLWIGTSKGLVRWKAQTLTHYPELAGKFVPKLFEDRGGTVWAAGEAVPFGILCAIRDRTVACDGKDGSFRYSPWSLYEDRKGNLWAGATGGLWKWQPEPRMFLSIPRDKEVVTGLAEDADGAVLFATVTGIRRITGRSTEPLPATRSLELRAEVVLRDRSGSLWIGTSNNGLVHVYQGRTDHFGSSDGLSGQSVSGLLEDREGNIWVTTENGLDRFRDVGVSRLSAKQGGPALVHGVAVASDGGIWITDPAGLAKSTNGGLLTYRSPGAARTTSGTRHLLVSGLPRGAATSVFEDAGHRIWLAFPTAFGYLRDRKFEEVPGVPARQVRTIIEDARANVWISDQQLGLFRVSADEQVTRIPWSTLGHTDFATAMAADRVGGGLWLAFFNGGIAYVEGGNVRASYGPADGLTGGWLKGLLIDDDAGLWVAGEGGLSRLHGGHITTLNHENGLPCDGVNWAIKDDIASLWLMTACGLVRITERDVDAWSSGRARSITPRVFDAADGVRSQSVPTGYSPYVVKAADGRLWFVGLDGVNVVDPRHLPFNDVPPSVHVERIVADRRSYDADGGATGQIRLPALTRDLQVDYTSLSLVVPERNRFRTMLEGWDRDWQDVGTRRQAFYSNLPPRSYRFRVIASNNSGVWNEAGAALDFSIAPAYYQTRWFVALSIVAVVAVAFGAHRIRLGIVEKHEAEISALNERLMKAQEQERIRIAGELHDGVMQEMLAMTMMLGSAKRRIGDPAAAQATIEKIQDKTIRIGNDIRRLSHDLHPPILQEAGLPKAVESYCEQFSGTSGVRVSCDVDDTASELSRGAALAVFRVMQEALGNAAKHGKATQITVRLTRTNGEVALIVSDNGIGFDPRRVLSSGLGLIMMRERATQLNGTFEFDTASGRGTTVRMAIPFR